jgi:hypothetical protein
MDIAIYIFAAIGVIAAVCALGLVALSLIGPDKI